MSKIVYKIVRVLDDEYFSAVASSSEADIQRRWRRCGLSLVYKVGKWTKVKIRHTKLFAFDTQEAAERYRDQALPSSLPYKIFKAKARGVDDGCVITFDDGDAKVARRRYLAEIVHSRDHGVVVCSSIQLLEAV